MTMNPIFVSFLRQKSYVIHKLLYVVKSNCVVITKIKMDRLKENENGLFYHDTEKSEVQRGQLKCRAINVVNPQIFLSKFMLINERRNLK